jgi:hypothetical protein
MARHLEASHPLAAQGEQRLVSHLGRIAQHHEDHAHLAHVLQHGRGVRVALGPVEHADEDDGGGEEQDNSWRTVPPWLLALACGAHAPLCDAYVRALVRPRRGAGVDSRRDAAARLRCVLASGGRS